MFQKTQDMISERENNLSVITLPLVSLQRHNTFSLLQEPPGKSLGYMVLLILINLELPQLPRRDIVKKQ